MMAFVGMVFLCIGVVRRLFRCLCFYAEEGQNEDMKAPVNFVALFYWQSECIVQTIVLRVLLF